MTRRAMEVSKCNDYACEDSSLAPIGCFRA